MFLSFLASSLIKMEILEGEEINSTVPTWIILVGQYFVILY